MLMVIVKRLLFYRNNGRLPDEPFIMEKTRQEKNNMHDGNDMTRYTNEEINLICFLKADVANVLLWRGSLFAYKFEQDPHVNRYAKTYCYVSTLTEMTIFIYIIRNHFCRQEMSREKRRRNLKIISKNQKQCCLVFLCFCVQYR